jgi:hypothetical protein
VKAHLQPKSAVDSPSCVGAPIKPGIESCSAFNGLFESRAAACQRGHRVWRMRHQLELGIDLIGDTKQTDGCQVHE